MIVVLGLGRETRAWLARRAPAASDEVVVLDEGTADGVSLPDGVELHRVDLDDVGAVAGVLGDRRVTRVVRSPGVSPYRAGPAALVASAPCATPTGLWLAEHRPTDLIAVTGTKGKSTVAALTTHLLRAAGRRTVLAGNIGVALTTVDADEDRDDLVLELSSYQLADLELPQPAAVAAVTTLFVDHVPWHGSVARYHTDKLRLLDLAEHRAVGTQVAASGLTDRFDTVAPPPTPGVVTALARAGLHGAHQAEAAMLALHLVERRIGPAAWDLVDALATFEPLPHRLQPVAIVAGRTFVDDSISTVPEATLAALATWRPRGPVTLLLGGDDRGQDLATLVDALADPELHVALLPPLGARVAAALVTADGSGDGGRVREVADLAEAVRWADRVTPRGGVVLLSPAAPSFGAFRDFAERGDTFTALARALPEVEG